MRMNVWVELIGADGVPQRREVASVMRDVVSARGSRIWGSRSTKASKYTAVFRASLRSYRWIKLVG